MSKRQLLLYSLVMILVLGNGTGLATMIPVYLSQLGTSSEYIGLLFSLLYLGLAASGILAGWLSDLFQHRKAMCIFSAAAEIGASLLLFAARSLTWVSAALFLSWFLAGIHIALVYVLVGLQAGQYERGRVFGMLGFMTGLGPILSGFLYGQLVDRYGFSMLFAINIGISVLWTFLTLLYVEPVSPAGLRSAAAQPVKSGLKGAFFLLTLASTLCWVTINGGKLGIPLVMNQLEFSAGDISLSAGVASLAALGMPLLLGWLSDRTGRKRLMLALNVLGVAALLFLVRASSLAQFCLASALLSLYSCIGGLSNALTADLVAPQSLGLGLSLMSNTGNIAGIFSSVLVGFSFGSLGFANTFLAAMVLPLAAMILLARVPERRPVLAKAVE